MDIRQHPSARHRARGRGDAVSDAIGRSVRLFLVDGKPTGLITAEIMNWTGHVLTGPARRTAQVPRLAPRSGAPASTLLHGPRPGQPRRARVLYIGESDQVGTRLKQHNQEDKKTYWERTCVITSKDQNITKAHARYLEARLIAHCGQGHQRAHARQRHRPAPGAVARGRSARTWSSSSNRSGSSCRCWGWTSCERRRSPRQRQTLASRQRR
ncbi:MAG: GIY-YIG nuclease family protein [Sphingobacterium sp.]|nr:GIY-YIG nuclease family protein [Sphingobacterium sp.]